MELPICDHFRKIKDIPPGDIFRDIYESKAAGLAKIVQKRRRPTLSNRSIDVYCEHTRAPFEFPELPEDGEPIILPSEAAYAQSSYRRQGPPPGRSRR